MRFLANVLWFVFGGFISGITWVLAGVMWCVTLVGIPIGVQCFKFAKVAFCPFGKEIVYGGGSLSLFANILWILFSGVPMAIENATIGIVLCCTIVGIPLGIQFFKIARLALMPFGAKVV